MLINDDDTITDDKTLAAFSEHYINTVEWSSALKPEKMKFENSPNTRKNRYKIVTKIIPVPVKSNQR